VNYWREALFAHPATAKSRPLVGCSACLLGEPVRYDGGHKLQENYQQQLLPWLQLQAICPEVGIGLGVPRPTLKLIDSDIGVRIVQVEDESRDVTDATLDYADSYLRQLGRFWPLCAYIFKARSPSCDTENGIFASRFKLWAPWLNLYREEDLQSPLAIDLFLLQSFVCRDILWQSAATDMNRLKAHYGEVLKQSLDDSIIDPESLWTVVKNALELQTESARQDLIDRYRDK
jgi:uncharacterized protein YbbK (DUF523 family)